MKNATFPHRLEPISLAELAQQLTPLRAKGAKVVFTNGCFDILHTGHVNYLERARALGDCLVVGVNSDASVRGLDKAPGRPICSELERATVLLALRAVDYVVIFNEPTPINLIEAIVPDILVKGGDWALETIVGRDVVEAAGGKVLALPFVKGHSTTSIVERILSLSTD